ncbi:hypothetical protein L596_000021 [Steinernema carpocapsae]|uniref:G-protein coupled receptors family 1 profile domain-containing protein n=1 Tax=Steinernema carpocapsae TaxID=34508 RepID=A0A4U8UHC5_STECR|nr:hypothetical protein L596_000021 [Steinernema carpocapsae]
MLRIIILHVVVVLGLWFNITVFWAYTKHKNRNLHVFEMTQTLLGILFSLLNVYYCYTAINDVEMKGTGCTIYGFLSGTLSLMSVYQPALMALEWCVIVIQPFMAKCITCTNRVVAVCGSAITILAVTIPPLFGIPSEYSSFDHVDFCCYDFTARDLKTRLFFFYLFTLGFFIPIAIFVLSLFLMCKQIRKSPEEVHKPLRVTTSAANIAKHRERSIAQKMFTLISVQLVCWSPFAIVTFTTNFIEQINLRYYTESAGLFAKFFVVLSPMVLFWKDLRATKMFQCFRGRNHTANSSSYLNPNVLGNNDAMLRHFAISQEFFGIAETMLTHP